MVAIEESTAAAAAGVSFSLTEEQKELCRLAHAFAEREIRPREAAHDAEQRHPVELIAHAHELGLMNLHVPAEYGGLGLSAFDGMLVGEGINWGCTGLGTSILAHRRGSVPAILFAPPEKRAHGFPPFADLPILCLFALTDPGAGSDVAALRSTAV